MTGWPDPERPGVPLNPERDGVHQLVRHDIDGCGPVVWLWRAGDQFWLIPGFGTPREAREAARQMRYLGPCLTPSEVAAQLAAARREGAEEMRERAIAAVERVRREKDAARLNEWGHPNSDELRRCYSYAEGAASDAAAAIRALAVEGGGDV